MNSTTNYEENTGHIYLVCPEYINLVCFVLSISGMYQSIEISHPVFISPTNNLSKK
jgi:hypothetical protein